MKMNAVVLAGGIPQPTDPLYEYSKGDSKALIDVAGKPMVQWIVDALCEAKSVDQIIVNRLLSEEAGQGFFAEARANRDAVKAGQDRERQKNEGQAYANDVIPRAVGSASRLKEEAQQEAWVIPAKPAAQ